MFSPTSLKLFFIELALLARIQYYYYVQRQQVLPKGLAPLTYTVRLWKELGALAVLGIQEQPNLAHNLNSFGSFQTKLDFMLQSTFAK